MDVTSRDKYWSLLTAVLFVSSWSLFAWVLISYDAIQGEYVYNEATARSDGQLFYVSRRIYPYLTAVLFLDQFTFLTLLASSQSGPFQKLKYVCGALWLPSLLIHVLYWCLNGIFI